MERTFRANRFYWTPPENRTPEHRQNTSTSQRAHPQHTTIHTTTHTHTPTHTHTHQHAHTTTHTNTHQHQIQRTSKHAKSIPERTPKGLGHAQYVECTVRKKTICRKLKSTWIYSKVFDHHCQSPGEFLWFLATMIEHFMNSYSFEVSKYVLPTMSHILRQTPYAINNEQLHESATVVHNESHDASSSEITPYAFIHISSMFCRSDPSGPRV